MHRNPLYNQSNFSVDNSKPFDKVFTGQLVDNINIWLYLDIEDETMPEVREAVEVEVLFRGRRTVEKLHAIKSNSDRYQVLFRLEYSPIYELEQVTITTTVLYGEIKDMQLHYDSYYSSLRTMRMLKKGFLVETFRKSLSKEVYRDTVYNRIDVDEPVRVKVLNGSVLFERLLEQQSNTFVYLKIGLDEYLIRNLYDSDHPSYNVDMNALSVFGVYLRYKKLDIYDFIELYETFKSNLSSENVSETLSVINNSITTYRSPIVEDAGYLTGESLDAVWMQNSFNLVEIEAFEEKEVITCIANSLRCKAARGRLITSNKIDLQNLI